MLATLLFYDLKSLSCHLSGVATNMSCIRRPTHIVRVTAQGTEPKNFYTQEVEENIVALLYVKKLHELQFTIIITSSDCIQFLFMEPLKDLLGFIAIDQPAENATLNLLIRYLN